MERALDPELLKNALGTHAALPSPGELEGLLEAAEIGLLRGAAEVPDELLAAGWYLHGVASAPAALQSYEAARQRQAFQVSSHVFDLALYADWLARDRFRLAVAAMVGFYESEVAPNAAAVYRRVYDHIAVDDVPFSSEPTTAALASTTLLLSLDRPRAYHRIRRHNYEVATLEKTFGVSDLRRTLFGACACVVKACWALLNFLTYGGDERLATSTALLRAALAAPDLGFSLDAKWCAAHLLRVQEGLSRSSVWLGLPPHVPGKVRETLARSDPPVLTLWPPQLSVLGDAQDSPLLPDIKRSFLSMPTSGGKSLLAQLLVLSHIASSQDGVCYVAPTHSLCREIRASLQSRLRVLRRQVRLDIGLAEPLSVSTGGHVDVMTPERFAFALRIAPENVLNRYGLFIIDEAHLVGDAGRGWGLEGALSLLHALTKNTAHRIVLLSAAVGNRAHFINWMNAKGPYGSSFHKDWRGPRRLTGVFTTDPRWKEKRTVPRKRASPLTEIPLNGVLHLQSAPKRRVFRLYMEDVGVLHLTKSRKKAGSSTPFYRMLVQLIIHLEKHGPVLVVCGTRKSARYYADALADVLPEGDSECLALASLAADRLGEAHPLPAALRKAVATHYSALPSEILTAIEELGRRGHLRFLVSTTALTEGVNLPVRTVVVAEQGGYTAEGYEQYISGPRLLNALGRAGRSGKETEGWLVLGHQQDMEDAVFDQLRAGPDQVTILSELATEKAIKAATEFEALVRQREDAVLENSDLLAQRFVSFVWSAMDVLGTVRESEPSAAELTEVLKATLAWEQASPEQQQVLTNIAITTRKVFRRTDPGRRARWARSGASLAAAAKLEVIADDVAIDYTTHGDENPWQSFVRCDVYSRLLALPDAPAADVWTTTTGKNRAKVPFKINNVVHRWLAGKSYAEIAQQTFALVKDDEYRLEQTVDLIASVVASYFSWMTSIIVSWVNERIVMLGHAPISDDLAAFIREGVIAADALELLRAGVHNRRLAVSVAAAFAEKKSQLPEEAPMPQMRNWLDSLGADRWRSDFAATPRDLLDLFDYVRTPGGGLLSDVLEGRRATMRLQVPALPADGAPITLGQVIDQDGFVRFALHASGAQYAVLPVNAQADLRALAATGLPLKIEVAIGEAGIDAHIALESPD